MLGITDALAVSVQAANHPANSGLLSMLPMLAAFVLIFYFMLLRPQNKRAKQQRTLIESLAKGDEVSTSGGLVGKVNEVLEQFVVLTLAEDTQVTLQKTAISTALPKGTLKHIK